ncbi:MAG: GTPase Era [Desulfuromonadales bacterium]|nr:GTPase Era [Desulfuromonadales bacterium]MDT8422183.1 GTPase Era [Desulfuromonadales bacterium]
MTDHLFKSGFVAIIGRPNVGKSTLLNRLLGQKIAITSNKPQTTRNRILGILTDAESQTLFLDTPGIHPARDDLNRFMVEEAVDACADVDMILLTIDAERPGLDRLDQLFKILDGRRATVLLGINKIDRIPRQQLLPMIAQLSKQFSFAEIIPFSAHTGEGVDTLLAAIRSRLPDGPRYYPEDILTDLPERFIVAEMVREQLLKQTHEEIPYGVAIVVESFTERTDRELIEIKVKIIVERASHKGIVLGKGGEKIRAIGTAARHDIERFIGSKVYLELFVKVQKNWTESARLRQEFGYK